MLPVSLDCPFLIAPAIFPIVYLLVIKESYRADTVHAKCIGKNDRQYNCQKKKGQTMVY
jgi:hypothetical protein